MSLTTEFGLSAAALGLDRIAAQLPEAEFSIERIAPIGEPVCYLQITADDPSSAVHAIQEAGLDATVIDELENTVFVRLPVDPATVPVYAAIERTGGRILDAAGDGESWSLRLRFPDSDALSEFWDRCQELDVDLELKQIRAERPLTEPKDPEGSLTRAQHHAILTAFRMGYFSVPRHATLADVADELAVSPAAASERIRRGLSTLVNESLSATEIDES